MDELYRKIADGEVNSYLDGRRRLITVNRSKRTSLASSRLRPRTDSSAPAAPGAQQDLDQLRKSPALPTPAMSENLPLPEEGLRGVVDNLTAGKSQADPLSPPMTHAPDRQSKPSAATPGM